MPLPRFTRLDWMRLGESVRWTEQSRTDLSPSPYFHRAASYEGLGRFCSPITAQAAHADSPVPARFYIFNLTDGWVPGGFCWLMSHEGGFDWNPARLYNARVVTGADDGLAVFCTTDCDACAASGSGSGSGCNCASLPQIMKVVMSGWAGDAESGDYGGPGNGTICIYNGGGPSGYGCGYGYALCQNGNYVLDVQLHDGFGYLTLTQDADFHYLRWSFTWSGTDCCNISSLTLVSNNTGIDPGTISLTPVGDACGGTCDGGSGSGSGSGSGGGSFTVTALTPSKGIGPTDIGTNTVKGTSFSLRPGEWYLIAVALLGEPIGSNPGVRINGGTRLALYEIVHEAGLTALAGAESDAHLYVYYLPPQPYTGIGQFEMDLGSSPSTDGWFLDQLYVAGVATGVAAGDTIANWGAPGAASPQVGGTGHPVSYLPSIAFAWFLSAGQTTGTFGGGYTDGGDDQSQTHNSEPWALVGADQVITSSSTLNYCTWTPPAATDGYEAVGVVLH